MGGGANATDPSANTVHGTNPQFLVHNILRQRIYESAWWKEHCFALSAETLVDKAMTLEYFGGAYGNIRKPTPFLCLILKMLQIQPEKDIVVELIKNEDFKYVRALGAFYLRLIGKHVDVYNYLEPLYNDMRKLRYRDEFGKYSIKHMDELVEDLIEKDFVCDVTLPYLSKRHALENSGALEQRVSQLEDDEDDLDAMMEEAEAAAEKLRQEMKAKSKAEKADKENKGESKAPEVEAKSEESAKPETQKKDGGGRQRDRERRSRSRSRSRSRGHAARNRRRSYSRSRSRGRDRRRSRSRSRDRTRGRHERSYSRSRSPDRESREKKDKKAKKEKKEKKEKKGKDANADEGGSKDTLTVDDTNKLRAQLGLKPLRA